MLWVVDNPNYPGTRLTAILREVVAIQIEASALTTRPSGRDTLSLVHRLLSRTKDVDSDLCRWSLSLRPSWQFTWMEAREAGVENYAYATHVHTYKTLWIARIWNSFRTARIKLQTTVWDLLGLASLLGGEEVTENQMKTQNIILRMVDDVCASVPFCLGNQTPLDSGPIARFPMDSISKRNSLHAWTMGWFLLLVPLQSCLKTMHLRDAQRTWLRAQLSRICQIGTMFMGGRDLSTLNSGNLPTFAFSMAIGSVSDTEAESEQMDSSWQEALSTAVQAPDEDVDGVLARLQKASSQIRQSDRETESAPPSAAASDKTKQPSEEGWLDFINTTKPNEIKTRALQKKIRRDVMLNHLRNSQRKERTPPGSKKPSRRQSKAKTGSPNSNEDVKIGGASQEPR